MKPNKRAMLSLLSVVFTGVLGAAGTASAQVNPAFSDLTGAVEDARTIVQAERKQTVTQAMDLTTDEAAKFWPLYDKYAGDLKKVNDARVKLITDYAASAWRMNDATADGLLNDMLQYNRDVQMLRENYVRKFKTIIPTVKVARFFQVENKLDAIMNFALARQIPLMPPAEAPLKKK